MVKDRLTSYKTPEEAVRKSRVKNVEEVTLVSTEK